MSYQCPLRPAKFLFWKYFKSHEWGIQRIYKFIRYSSRQFTVEYKCPHCKLTREDSFVNPETLMMQGFTKEQLDIFTRYEKWNAPLIEELPKPLL